MSTDRRGNFAYYNGDPTVRTYALGDDARRSVVDFVKQQPNGDVAVDIETDGLAEESYTVKVIIIGNETHACVLNAFDPQHIEAARDACAAAQELTFHNSPFDVPPLYHAGVLALSDVDKVWDTLITANMAITDSFGGRSLADLEKKILKIDAMRAAKDRFKQWCKINKMSLSEGFKRVKYSDPSYTMYAGWDAIVTKRIKNPLIQLAIKQLTNHPFGRYGADLAQAIYLIHREQVVNRVMLKRSCRGLAYDADKLNQEQDRLVGSMSDLEARLREFGVDKPTNPGELVAALVKADALPEDYPWTAGGKNISGRPSTAGANLEKLDHPAAVAYMQYADNNRLMNYLESARKIADKTDGRLHPIVSVMKAVTGRMSYGAPAFQQFIAAAREMVLFDDIQGNPIHASSNDWSQIEPVIMMNLSKDMGPLSVYESGGDLYDYVAETGGVPRTPAKVGLLSTAYGAQPAKIAKSLAITEEKAQEVINKVAEVMPLSWRLIGWSAEWTRVTGKTFTLSGRIIDVSRDFSYKGTNFTIQGSGYDVLADTIVEGHRRGMDDTFFLAFHDETITSKDSAAEWCEIMATPPQRMIDVCQRIPVLRVDSAMIGERWRTPPKNPCATSECRSESALRWTGDAWLCGAH